MHPFHTSPSDHDYHYTHSKKPPSVPVQRVAATPFSSQTSDFSNDTKPSSHPEDSAPSSVKSPSSVTSQPLINVSLGFIPECSEADVLSFFGQDEGRQGPGESVHKSSSVSTGGLNESGGTSVSADTIIMRPFGSGESLEVSANISQMVNTVEQQLPPRLAKELDCGPLIQESPAESYDDPPEVDPSELPQTPTQQPASCPTSPPSVSLPSLGLFGSLVPDPSQYANTPTTPPHPETEGTTLSELAHVVRLAKYQKLKRAKTRLRLHRHFVYTALSARLLRCSEQAHRQLVDFFRSDDKKGFAGLYTALHDVRASREEFKRYALIESEMESKPVIGKEDSIEETLSGNTGITNGPTSVTSFLNALLPTTRDTLLKFLARIRTDPEYLSERLCSLSTIELSNLTKFSQTLDTVDSVLPYPGRPSSRGHAILPNRSSPNSMSAVERMLSFQRKDPFAALIHTCFANSAGPGSEEEKRRVNVWATVCARLITNRMGVEPIIVSVLNAWATFWDWHGKSNIEWYIMSTLEAGSFILDRAEDSQGTRFNLKNWTQVDDALVVAFYEKAVAEFFDIIDNEEGTGIPEGFLELAREIVKRIPAQKVGQTWSLLIARGLFQSFYAGVLTHPEAHGLMPGYHITSYGRQKILREVAQRALRHVNDCLMLASPLTNTPPAIRQHIINITNRIMGKCPSSKLLPVSAVTGLKETKEAHPYLMISPCDLVTLVNALYPNRRPRSRTDSISFRSVAPSVAGSSFSQGFASRSADETSVLSMSLSAMSVASDGGLSNVDAWRNNMGTDTAAPGNSVLVPSLNPSVPFYLDVQPPEDDESLLRQALADMGKVVGPDAMNGAAHPYAEDWAVIFISANGKELSTHMLYDQDEDGDLLNEGWRGESSSSSEDEEEESADDELGLDFAKDFKGIRAAVLKLVEDFEIPTDGDRDEHLFSNRVKGLNKGRHRYESSVLQSPGVQLDTLGTATQPHEEPLIIRMLHAATTHTTSVSDFSASFLYYRTLTTLLKTPPSLRTNNFRKLLTIFSRGPLDIIRRSTSAIEHFTAFLIWLQQSQERQESQIERMSRRLRALRDNMWFVSDVVNSEVYCDARSICVALKAMGVPKKHIERKQGPRGKNFNVSHVYANEIQFQELLSAKEHMGGPNKLSDEQVENTKRWLDEGNWEVFCGEERLFRFIMEVTNVVRKLTGDTVMEAPVLWTSELYDRDWKSLEKKRLESKKKAERDSGVSWGDDAGSASKRPVGTGLFGSVFGSRSESTLEPPSFWSPFNQGPPKKIPGSTYTPSFTDSSLNVQALTSPSLLSDETFYLKFTQAASEEKTAFLTDLRRTLTSLLLSDFGNLVFAQGSETDEWMVKYGGPCIERKLGPLDKRYPMPGTDSLSGKDGNGAEFPFARAYQRLLQMFSVHPNPFAKLQVLHSLISLVTSATASSRRPKEASSPVRPSSLQRTASSGYSAAYATNVQALTAILSNPSLRPTTLFRDLQFVAILVPDELLVKKHKGLSFYDVVAAALSVKLDACETMMAVAQDIIAAETQAVRVISPSTKTPSETNSVIPGLTISDAATILSLLARQSHPTASPVIHSAQKDLALLYMMRPELLERVTFPFVKAGDVFKKGRKENEGTEEGGKEGVIGLAVHWMQRAAAGGDEDAINYLKQQMEDM